MRAEISIVNDFELTSVGTVESVLEDLKFAPRQPHSGAPAAVLRFEPAYAEALTDIRPGDQMLLLTWLDRAQRNHLRARPGGDPTKTELGVFSTRSPNRPNPIGLHEVTVTRVDGVLVEVGALEVLNGTPILDLKPELRRRT